MNQILYPASAGVHWLPDMLFGFLLRFSDIFAQNNPAEKNNIVRNLVFSFYKNNAIIHISFCNRSLTDRTQDSDSCNVGSIPAGCI